MFRYLEKYVGTYAVKKPEGISTTDTQADDLYIPCGRGKNTSIRHTYEEDKLCVLFLDGKNTANNVYKSLKKTYPKMYLEFEDCGTDAYIYFMDEDFDRVAAEVKPRTSGKMKAPYGKKSIENNPYCKKRKKNTKSLVAHIPEEEEKKFSDLGEGFIPIKRAQATRECCKKILTSHNLIKEQKESGIKAKEFIYAKGYWNELLAEMKKFYKNEVK